MSTFFLEIFEITLGMSVLILAMILILRLFGKKFTAKCRYVLWGLVLVRLAIPFGVGVLPAVIEVPIVPAIVESGELNGELTEIVTPGDSVTDNVIDSTDMPSVTNPTEPTIPTNPINPTNPTIPVSPSTPAEPSTPTIPETPPTPTDPVITPISPNGDNTTDPMKEQITTPDPVTETPHETVSAGTILEIISTVYIMGAAVFFTWNMISYVIYTRRILAAARPADSRTAAVFKSICAKENLSHTPTLLVSPEINSPAAFGIFSRKVVLPDIDFTDNALAGTLFHEVVHCKRGDLYVKLIGLLARSLHWFNPLVYIAAMRCEMEMEMSCDERVLAGVSDEARVAYGSVMLDIIRRCRRNKGALTTHFNPKKSSVKTRFANIINGSGKRNGKILIAICLVLCIIAGTIIACTTDPVDTPEETESESESETTEPVETPDDFTIEPTEVYELPIEVPEDEVILQFGSYGDNLLLGTDWITVDGLNGDAKVATIRAGADGEGYIVFACGTWTHKSRPTERRAYFTSYHTYRVVCEGGFIIEVEKVDTITAADVLEYGKPYTGSLDGEHECIRAGDFDGLLRYYGFTIDGSSITAKVGAYATSGGTTKNGKFTYDLETGELVANFTYEIYNYETESKEVENETVTGKLLEYKGFVHFVKDEDPMETLPIAFLSKNDDTHSGSQIDVAQYVNVIENNAGLDFSTIVIPKNDFISCCYFDEEHVLVSTYDVERDENNQIKYYSDFTLYLINTMRGTLEDFVVLGDMSYRPISKNYTENGLILSDWHLDDDGNMVILGAILVSQQGGRLSVVPDNTEIYPRHDSILKSPDGRYTVFDTTDDGTGHGGIDVVYPDGTTKRILTNVMEGDPGVTSLGSVTGYSPIQFIDNERLLYHIGGWEWTQGYGIYNLATGEKTEFREGYAAMGYSDGYIYLSKSSGYEIVSYHKATLDGEILDTVEPDDNSIELGSGVAYAMFIREGQRKIYSVDSLLETLNRTHSDVVYYVYDGNGDKWAELAKVHYDTSEAEIYAISHDNRETTLIFVDGAPMPEKTAGDAPIVNVLENNAGLDINTVFLPVYKSGGYMDAIKFDEEHMLYITYEVAKNEETGKYYKTKPHLYLIDILNGEIKADSPYYVPDGEEFSSFDVDYTDDGLILMEMGNLGDRLGVIKAHSLTLSGDNLVCAPIVNRFELYPYNSNKIVSPTGEYVVYYRDEGGYGDGGIDIVYAGGAKYRFLNNVTLDNAGGSLGAVTYYTPVGFADDSHLVYSIGGYEHIKGFGIYDLATGENKMFDDGKYQLSIVGDGVISFEEVRRNDEGLPEQYRTWTMTLDGKMTLTASVDEADGVPTMPRNISNRLRSEPIYSFTSRSFKEVPDYFYKTVSYVVESIYSPDMKEKLAVIEYPSDSNQRAVRNIHFADNSVTIVLPVDPAALSTGSEDTPLVNVISNPGGLNVQTVYIPTYINGRSAYANIFEFDERYVICVTYDDSYNNATLYVIDTALGQVIHEEALAEYGSLGSPTYIDSSVVLMNYYVQIEGVSCRRSTEIRIENGAVQVIEGLADYVGYPRCEGQVKSPDGRYTAYNVLDDEAYRGGVDLLCPDGTIKRIKENYVILIGEGVESDVYGCISRYSPLGFMDDKHLVIILGGYESPSGYEIYNVETGEFTQGLARERVDDYYNIEYSPAAIIDGYLYLYVWKDGQGSHDEEIIGVGKIDLDGNFTMLAHRDETDGVFVLTEDEYFTIRNGVWHMYDSRFNAWSMKLDEFFKSTGYRVTKKFYSADFEFLLELEYPYFTLKAIDDVYVYGDTCTVITFVDNSNVISASAFETAYRNAENVYSWFTGYGGFEALMEWTTVDGQSYQRCDMLEFDTLAELESITARYFSKDLTDKLMNTTAGMFGTPLYVEENGKLYKVSGYFSQFGYDAVYDYKFERLGYSDGEYSVKVTASFCPYGKEFTASAVCKYVIMDDGSIVFTEFPLMIEELTSLWVSLSQIEDSGTTVSREDLSSIYKDVEFTTYTYDESDFYGYTVTIDIPSYCYRYNGVYLEPNTLTNSDDNIYRALLTKYEHSYAEFEAGVDLYRDANIMSIKNRTSVFKDISSENINGFFGYIDKDGTRYCVYAFYFPTDRHGEAIVLYLWQRLGADGNLYYSNVILPIVRSVKIEKESTTQEGGTIYFTSNPTSFLPPEASSRVGDLKFGNSHIITYASDKYGLCVYYSYGLDAESFVMLKTEFEPADIQAYSRSEVLEPELNEDGIVIATVRYFHYGSACYTDVTYELDPSLYVSHNEPNEERIYRTPVWKVVDKAFTLHERAVVSLIAGKNGCVEFWHKFMGSDRYLYFITVRDEEHNPTKHFSLYYFDAGNAGNGFDLVNIEIPEDVEYDTIMPINYITGGGSMECRFYLELTKDGEVFYVAFDNFHWETGDDILDFRYQGIVSDDEIAELHANYPDLFKDLAE